jgi:hypothetical protein
MALCVTAPEPLSWNFIDWITYESIPSAGGLSSDVSHQVACEIFLSKPDANSIPSYGS